jgi:hypothetical protein
MKTLLIILSLYGWSNATEKLPPAYNKTQVVNSILGDMSYVQKFHTNPNLFTDEKLRLQTHLEYVENLLRQKDVSHLSIKLRKKRAIVLDLLHVYWTKGIFPKNYDYQGQRRPCFIDCHGNICAVGYLIEQTTSRQVAENINKKFKYEFLLNMNDAVIDHWIESNGLTKLECAMIQPQYGSTIPPNYNHVPAAYGVPSAVWSGLNVSLITMNGIQIGKGYKNPAFPIIGLVSGAGQIIFGAATWPKDYYDAWSGATYSNDSQKNVCMVNIGVGTSTMILSTLNLIINRKKKNQLTQWNVYSYPTYNNQVGIGFSFSRSF